MTLGSARALVRTARKDGHIEAHSVRYGYAECPHYTMLIGVRGFDSRQEYEDWKREQAAKEREER